MINPDALWKMVSGMTIVDNVIISMQSHDTRAKAEKSNIE
jgi:hypothetical protein